MDKDQIELNIIYLDEYDSEVHMSYSVPRDAKKITINTATHDITITYRENSKEKI